MIPPVPTPSARLSPVVVLAVAVVCASLSFPWPVLAQGAEDAPLSVTAPVERQDAGRATMGSEGAAGGEPTQGMAGGEAPQGEVITVTEAEARACAAKLEPMAATYKDPASSIYMQKVGEGVLRVWAPRDGGPNAPFRPWCLTTVHAVAGIDFLNPGNRTTITEILGTASAAFPPIREGAEEPVVPPTVVVEEEEDEEDGLPAAFQRLPPKGGRSAAEVGVPLPPLVISSLGLPPMLEAALTVCADEGGQMTTVHDRTTGGLLRAECRHPDGTATVVDDLLRFLGEEGAGLSMAVER